MGREVLGVVSNGIADARRRGSDPLVVGGGVEPDAKRSLLNTQV